MSVRTKVLGLVDVIMRVPPLFIIDEILKISMGIPPNANTTNSGASELLTESNLSSIDRIIKNSTENPFNDEIDFYKVLSLTTLKFIVCLLGEFFFPNLTFFCCFLNLEIFNYTVIKFTHVITVIVY